MKLSIIFPMYNEAKIIAGTVESVRRYIDFAVDFDCEVVFVSDGSSDGCEKIAAEAAAGDDRFVVTGYSDNRGKGGAVRYGMLHSSGDFRVFTDCDLAYGCDIIGEVARACRDRSCDIVIGSRNIDPSGYEGYTFLRKFASKTYIKLISIVAGFKHSDSQSGVKCYTKKAAEDVFPRCEVNRFAFDLESLMIAEKLGYEITEYPVRVINHNESQSKVRLFRDTFQMLGDIRKIKKRTKTIR